MADLATQRVNEVERMLMEYPQAAFQMEHFFAPGIYIRQITMPAGAMVVGHQHRTEHPNVILSGRALVSIDGVVEEITAGMTFVSRCGARKVLLVIEEMVWQTTHCIDTSDIPNVSQLTREEKELVVARVTPQLIKPTKAWEQWKIEQDMNTLTTKGAKCLSQQ